MYTLLLTFLITLRLSEQILLGVALALIGRPCFNLCGNLLPFTLAIFVHSDEKDAVFVGGPRSFKARFLGRNGQLANFELDSLVL